jgi:hypothetical protein
MADWDMTPVMLTFAAAWVQRFMTKLKGGSLRLAFAPERSALRDPIMPASLEDHPGISEQYIGNYLAHILS